MNKKPERLELISDRTLALCFAALLAAFLVIMAWS
jgi:hypothetical protein